VDFGSVDDGWILGVSNFRFMAKWLRMRILLEMACNSGGGWFICILM
jgi:hypothetical protein